MRKKSYEIVGDFNFISQNEVKHQFEKRIISLFKGYANDVNYLLYESVIAG
jgi:hypothetical protein